MRKTTWAAVAGGAAIVLAASGIGVGAALGSTAGVPVEPSASAVQHAQEIQQAYEAVQAGIPAQQAQAAKWAAEEQARIAAEKAAEKAAQEAAARAAAEQAAKEQAARELAKRNAEQQAHGGPAQAAPDDQGHPSGTPLPMQQVTDPNNGQYGQMVIAVDPASWCASHSGTTRGGVPQCT